MRGPGILSAKGTEGSRQTQTQTWVLATLVALQSHAGTGTAMGHAAHTRQLGERPYATESAVPECVDLSYSVQGNRWFFPAGRISSRDVAFEYVCFHLQQRTSHTTYMPGFAPAVGRVGDSAVSLHASLLRSSWGTL